MIEQVDPPLASLGTAVARELSGIADEEILNYRNQGAREEGKGSQDLVTVADRSIEQRLVATLQNLLPGSRVRGEEGANAPAVGDSRFEWVLDPIDGTVNFARGYEFFTSVVALIDEGRPVLSVAYLPESGDCVIAARGMGCTLMSGRDIMRSGSRLSVTQRPLSQTVHSIMITPKLSPAAREASLAYAATTLDLTLGFRVLVSQAYEAVKLAAGGIDVVVSFHSSGGWSRDASRLICEEGGGVFAVIEHKDHPGTRGFVLTTSFELLAALTPLFESVQYDVVSDV